MTHVCVGSSKMPDYDFGDGPKPSMAQELEQTPRNYCMLRSKEKRGPHIRKEMEPTEEYDAEVGDKVTLARGIELSAVEYSNMRSKVDRFVDDAPEHDCDFSAQRSKTIGKTSATTAQKYSNLKTKTPRFKKEIYTQGGQDFYQVDTAHKKSLSNGIKAHPIRYKGSLGSQTARFPSEVTGYGAKPEGDPDGMNYNTDLHGKMTFATSVEKGARKYSQLRSKVPRFSSEHSGKKKGKKLDMDAVYEAELKRVTGVREPADYYIPNYGAHRGVGEQVKRSHIKYAASFQSKTPLF